MRHRVGIIILAAAATAIGCVHQDGRPALTGPSALAQSVTVTARPDVLYLGQNGPGQSATIVVQVRDESGGPETSRVDIRLDIVVGSTIQDCGTLTQKNIQTGSDGIATTTFTAPRGNPLPAECAGFSPGQSITIQAVPVGTNFQAYVPWTTSILMVSQGVILPPPGTPTAQFTFSPASPQANSQVAFDGSTSCGGQLSGGTCPATSPAITSYSWNFGDGDTASGATVSHDFSEPGPYNVTLTVTNSGGGSASVTRVVNVGAGVGPSGDWTVSPTPVVAGSPAFFNADGVRPAPGHTIVSYIWNWGDGTPNGSGVQTAHTFAVAGVYTVTLTATDDAGQAVVISKGVTVSSGNPTASFTSTNAVGSPPGHTVVFNGTSSTAVGNATIVSYVWDFGDGFAGAGAVTSHPYAAGLAGTTVSVTLTVTDNNVPARSGSTTRAVVVP